MDITVWVADGQLQCCGTPFRPGERVTWTVENDPGPHDLERLAGVPADGPVTVDAVEEHHPADGDRVEPVVGTVVSVRALSCRLLPAAEGGTTYVPVPGSGVLTEVELADGWTGPPAGTDLVGHLVELTGAARGDRAAR